MQVGERQQKILDCLKSNPKITVAELARQLYVSEPTIRRDFTELDNKGYITKIYGGAILNRPSPDGEISFMIRENERSTSKVKMGLAAAKHIQDGMVVMLDGSTSAYYLVPYLEQFKDLIVVTSGAKTAVALAGQNIRTFSTGGQMLINSFSNVGLQAESFVQSINADVLFFSCRGLTADGRMTDRSIEEANLRKIMLKCATKKILLCDSSKLYKTCFYNIGHISELDYIISDTPLPEEIVTQIPNNENPIKNTL